jgi:flagellin
MASVLNTNMASISAQRFLTSAQSKLQASYERLSSGSRINRAQDDAAGNGVSQRLISSINSTSMGIRNANDAIGMLQTAEGALTEITSMLQRMKELSVQGANDALNSSQRAFLVTEMKGLAGEIGAIADRTKFNGISLLNNTDNEGNADILYFQTGAEISDIQTVQTLQIITDEEITALLGRPETTDEVEDSFAGTENFAESSEPTVGEMKSLNSKITNAIDSVSTMRATFGAQVNRLNSNINNLTALFENLSAANSRIMDTDYANETASLTKTQILQQAATAMLSQANAQPNVVLALLK